MASSPGGLCLGPLPPQLGFTSPLPLTCRASPQWEGQVPTLLEEETEDSVRSGRLLSVPSPGSCLLLQELLQGCVADVSTTQGRFFCTSEEHIPSTTSLLLHDLSEKPHDWLVGRLRQDVNSLDCFCISHPAEGFQAADCSLTLEASHPNYKHFAHLLFLTERLLYIPCFPPRSLWKEGSTVGPLHREQKLHMSGLEASFYTWMPPWETRAQGPPSLP